MVYSFKPQGVCSMEMIVDIENDIIKSVQIKGGCPGNSLGVSALVVDMHIDEAIKRLKGIPCGIRSTSCPDQLSIALEEAKKSINK